MEMPLVPKIPVAKSDEVGKIQTKSKAAAAYGKSASVSEEDKLSLSANARLMQSLRTAYGKLPTSQGNVNQVKSKLAEGGSVILSSEEIVTSILQGTLFQAL